MGLLDKGVTVCCLAYNHSKYIRDALEGFVNQNVCFPYKVIVHDDASTDTTADIIREYSEKYPDIIYPIFQNENQASQEIAIFEKYFYPNLIGEYVAFCEGDDYWVDNNKLSRQYSYMEENKDTSFCVHNSMIVNSDGSPIRIFNSLGKDHDYSTKDLLEAGPGQFFQTSSFFIRRDICLIPMELQMGVGDYNRALYASTKGKIHFFNEVMSHYRIHEGSWTERVIGNEKNKIAHYKVMKEFFDRFDRYTNYAYTNIITEKKYQYDVRILPNEKHVFDIMFSKQTRETINTYDCSQKLEIIKRIMISEISRFKKKILGSR